VENPTFLKYIFLFHSIACIIYGLVFFLSPEFYVDATGWPFFDPVAGRVMGSLFIGFSVTAILGYRAASWEEVKIIVLADITWGIFAVISMVWMMLVYTTIPALANWFNVIVAGIFILLFLYAYFKVTR
jgi:hypothetical protein